MNVIWIILAVLSFIGGQVYLFYQGKATLTGGYRLSCLKVEFVE